MISFIFDILLLLLAFFAGSYFHPALKVNRIGGRKVLTFYISFKPGYRNQYDLLKY